MDQFINLLLWIVVLMISGYLFYRVAGTLSITRLNMISFIFYYSLLVSSFIGSLLIVLGIDESYITARLIFQEQSRQMGFYYVCIVMVLLPLVMWIVCKMFGFQAQSELKRYWDSPVVEVFTKEKGKREFYGIITALSILCVLSILYTIYHTPQIPLFAAILDPGANLAAMRISASTDFTGIVYIKNLIAKGLTPLLSMVVYVYALKTKEFRWKILFILLFFSAVFIQLYNLEKSPVLFYFLMILMIRLFIGKTILNWRRVGTFALLGIIYLVTMYSAFGVTNLSSYLSYSTGPVGRIILTQIAPMYVYVDRYGEYHPFLEEKGLPPAILKLYGIDSERPASVIMEDLFPEGVKEGTAGVMNTLYVGELYAGFGVLGIILGTILLGVLIQAMYIMFLRLPKHPIFIALFAYFTINFPRALVGGFFDITLNPIWIGLSLALTIPYGLIHFRQSFKDFLSGKNLERVE